FMCVPIIASIGYTIWFLLKYHYLPQPFFYEPSGTWMDWYSLTQWGQHKGAYDTAQSIYPPLSFVLLKLFAIPHCYDLTYSEEVRPCDWVGGLVLTLMWLVNFPLTYFSFRKIDRATALPRAFALAFGFPMLFAFERGNLLLFCYACVVLAYGPLLKSARLRWLFAGIAVNFKVYLVAALLAPLLRRRWLAVEGAVICTVLVYLVTWYILGEGSPAQLIRNLGNYSGGFGAAALLDLWFPSSYIPVRLLLDGSFPVYVIMGSQEAAMIYIGITVFMRFVQALIVLAAVAAWFRPEVVPPHRLVYLAISLALSASEAGGYTQVLLILFVFMETWRGIARPIAIVIAYVLCISFDITFSAAPPLVRDSFLGNTYVIAEYGFGLMSLLRPGMMLTMAALLSGVTIAAVWADIRQQGWRGRWRYRRDLPLLPGVLRPAPIAARAAPEAE
uniref:glycosyltransferase 87 family protein n=1 Tax=Novosphingobium sp. Chol11 TaxID=1385763 RepID=UPI0025E6740D